MLQEKNVQEAFSEYQTAATSENQSKLEGEKKLIELYIAVQEGELQLCS